MESIASTAQGLAEGMFKILTSGVDVITASGQTLVDAMTRAAMIPYMMTQKIMARHERTASQQAGIEQAKKGGKYTGRKPIAVDTNTLRQVARELDEGLITIEEAMKRTNIPSRSTFYRKLKTQEIKL